MSRLSRYVLKEILAPTLVAFLAYTGFMLLRGLILFADLVLQSENPVRDTGLVLAFSVPHIVVLTIPIAFLLGLLIGVGRLSADSELVALRASGIDLARLYRPIGIVAGSTFVLTLFLMVAVVPRANRILYGMKLQLSTFAVAQRIQPGVFSPELAGRRIYVEGASADRKTLTGLIVSDRSSPEEGERLTLARRGTLEVEEDEGRLWLRLEGAVTHHIQSDPSRYDRSSYEVQRLLLDDANPKERIQRTAYDKQLREQTLPELLDRAARRQNPIEGRMAWVEIHKKFALPAACLVFGLLGLPLGIVNRRGGRAAGFAVSVAIVLGYYVLLAGGEARAIEGSARPGIAMWLPNAILLALGLLALSRVRRDRPLFASELPRLFRRTPREGAARASLAAAPRPVERATQLRSPFLLVDRYVAGRFLRVFALVVSSFVVLYVLIDYMEISDDIAKNHPPRAIVLGYYEALLPPILLQIVPFAFLVSALIATASLVRSSETTALLSHGISLYRSVGSLLVLASATGALLFFFAERIVPAAQAESERLRDVILKHPPVTANGLVNAWFRGEGGRFYSAGTFDPKSRIVTGLAVLELEPASFRLLRRTEATRGVLVGSGLRLTDGWTRTFGPSGESLFLRRDGTFFVPAPEASKVFYAGRTDPRQMTSRELSRFIDTRRRAGANVAALRTGLYQKGADAFAALLLTVVGLPFAFRFGKRGAVAGIGIALLLGIGYLFLSQGILLKAGEAGALPPLLAAWGANVLFGLAAIHGLLGVRS